MAVDDVDLASYERLAKLKQQKRWRIQASDFSRRCSNPIRKIVDNIKPPANSDKSLIPLSLGGLRALCGSTVPFGRELILIEPCRRPDSVRQPRVPRRDHERHRSQHAVRSKKWVVISLLRSHSSHGYCRSLKHNGYIHSAGSEQAREAIAQRYGNPRALLTKEVSVPFILLHQQVRSANLVLTVCSRTSSLRVAAPARSRSR